MRGLTPEERERLEISFRRCNGTPLSAEQLHRLRLTDSQMKIVESLISQRRLAYEKCSCGYRHPYTTAEGKQALLYDHLAKNTTDLKL